MFNYPKHLYEQSIKIYKRKINHFNECPNVFINCRYKYFGCKFCMLRHEEAQHLKDHLEEHLQLFTMQSSLH